MAALAHGDWDPMELVAMAARAPSLEGRDLAAEVATKKPRLIAAPKMGGGSGESVLGTEKPRAAVVDFGCKGNILRLLAQRCSEVVVLPPGTGADGVLEYRPDGVLLSNGPGDPAALPYAAATARGLFRAGVPVFGICLGHQIVALALGARTFKLTFGHHGTNHPVQDFSTGKVLITSQNHNYSVDPQSLPEEVEVTQRSLYDGTVEAMAHRYLPIFSVQYHPEASPGPHDASDLFDRFIEAMVGYRARRSTGTVGGA